jgi:hypothetical protein
MGEYGVWWYRNCQGLPLQLCIPAVLFFSFDVYNIPFSTGIMSTGCKACDFPEMALVFEKLEVDGIRVMEF